MVRVAELVCIVASGSLAAAHTVMLYPGSRGNNLHTNGTVSPTDPSIPPGSLGINWDNGTYGFPYGMQWMYPCGGMPMSRNRTKWPIKGGAIAVQPGWFPGHSVAQFYFNMGYGNEPLNYSHQITNFAITGPSNQQYEGTFCMPQVGLPMGYHPKVGDNATIQVIELAQHGASLYNCVDITFADPEDPNSGIERVTAENCFNSTQPGQQIGFEMIYTTTNSPAPPNAVLNLYTSILAPLLLVLALSSTWM
ncbi:hypothetical protein ACEQ8H_003414 [Pleosporales sp. CAS-2024a]